MCYTFVVVLVKEMVKIDVAYIYGIYRKIKLGYRFLDHPVSLHAADYSDMKSHHYVNLHYKIVQPVLTITCTLQRG